MKSRFDGRGYFNTIAGYRVTPNKSLFVSIVDPLYGSSEVSYKEFTHPHGGYRDGAGMWFASFLVRKKAAS